MPDGSIATQWPTIVGCHQEIRRERLSSQSQARSWMLSSTEVCLCSNASARTDKEHGGVRRLFINPPRLVAALDINNQLESCREQRFILYNVPQAYARLQDTHTDEVCDVAKGAEKAYCF